MHTIIIILVLSVCLLCSIWGYQKKGSTSSTPLPYNISANSKNKVLKIFSYKNNLHINPVELIDEDLKEIFHAIDEMQLFFSEIKYTQNTNNFPFMDVQLNEKIALIFYEMYKLYVQKQNLQQLIKLIKKNFKKDEEFKIDHIESCHLKSIEISELKSSCEDIWEAHQNIITGIQDLKITKDNLPQHLSSEDIKDKIFKEINHFYTIWHDYYPSYMIFCKLFKSYLEDAPIASLEHLSQVLHTQLQRFDSADIAVFLGLHGNTLRSRYFNAIANPLVTQIRTDKMALSSKFSLKSEGNSDLLCGFLKVVFGFGFLNKK